MKIWLLPLVNATMLFRFEHTIYFTVISSQCVCVWIDCNLVLGSFYKDDELSFACAVRVALHIFECAVLTWFRKITIFHYEAYRNVPFCLLATDYWHLCIWIWYEYKRWLMIEIANIPSEEVHCADLNVENKNSFTFPFHSICSTDEYWQISFANSAVVCTKINQESDGRKKQQISKLNFFAQNNGMFWVFAAEISTQSLIY